MAKLSVSQSVSQFRLTRLIAGAILAVGCGTANMAFADECYVDDPDIRGTYTGGCVNGKAHGQGESKGKDHYKGEFVNGKTQGRGIYTWANGRKYDGEFKDNKLHGKGVLTWASGSKYDGEFKDNKLHGKGVYTWADGGKYDGEFKDDKRHGLGKLTFPKGHKNIATWSKGFWQGDTYIVQGIFENGNNLVLECEPNKQACEKARIEKEEANERACQSRYVGERLHLRAPYSVPGFLWYSNTEYTDLPFKVVGVGKDRMTVEAVYNGGIIGKVESANVPCNATSIE